MNKSSKTLALDPCSRKPFDKSAVAGKNSFVDYFGNTITQVSETHEKAKRKKKTQRDLFRATVHADLAQLCTCGRGYDHTKGFCMAMRTEYK